MMPRVSDDETLDNANRRRLYEYICVHPGMHISALKRRMKCSMTTVTYHLRVLEKAGLVRFEKRGNFQFYYPIKGANEHVVKA